MTEASPDTAAALKPVEPLVGATLQPVAGQPDGAGRPEPGPDLTPPVPSSEDASPPSGWWRRLTEGMRRTSSAIGDSVTSLFTKKKLDQGTLDDLEDVLIGADLGVETATRITKAVGSGRYGREISAEEVREIMADEIEKVLAPVALSLSVDRTRRPFVLLMIGVNGAVGSPDWLISAGLPVK